MFFPPQSVCNSSVHLNKASPVFVPMTYRTFLLSLKASKKSVLTIVTLPGPSLCRMVYVQSLTLGDCFHIASAEIQMNLRQMYIPTDV